jgi:NAD(P)-dependent dehydrogenase (short-subunit alcohol dehydrogenase family)
MIVTREDREPLYYSAAQGCAVSRRIHRYTMDLLLDGRVAVVTGGSSGIGLASLERFLSEGCAVAFCARDAARVASVTRDLTERFGERVLGIAGDVTDEAAMLAFAEAVHARFGRADVLVHSAGQSRQQSFSDLSDADWEAELRLKFFGLIRPTRAFLPLLRVSDRAAIVCVAARSAKEPEPKSIATSAARAGTVNLAKSLARDLAPEGIRVNSLLLGVVASGQTERRWRARVAAGETLTLDEHHAELARDRGIPIGRIGTPTEIAAAVAFFASPLSGYTTGSSIEISGGIGRAI